MHSASSADIGHGFDLLTGPSWTERTANIQLEFPLTPVLHWHIFIGTSVNPLFAKVDGEEDQTCGLAGRAPPLGLFLLRSQVTGHADPYRRADASQSLPQSHFWSGQSVWGAGEWRLNIAEVRDGWTLDSPSSSDSLHTVKRTSCSGILNENL